MEFFKSRKEKSTFEMNWKIREIFSQSFLASFNDEIYYKFIAFEKNN